MGRIVSRIGSEVCRLVTADGQRLRISDSAEQHVERIRTDIADSAYTCGAFLNKRGAERSRDSATAAAACLQIVYLTELTGVNYLFDHFHIFAHTGLEADGKYFARLLLGLHDLDSLVKCNGERLLKHNVYTVVKSVDSRCCVLAVVGADRYAVEILLGIEQLLVAVIEADVFNAVLLGKCLSLARNKVSHRNNLNIRHIFVCGDV